MNLYPTCGKCGCPRHPGLGCGCKTQSATPLPKPCPLCKRATNAAIAEALTQENATLRRQNSIERGEAASEVDRLRKAIGAIRDALHQEHLRGAFKDTLWMPEAHARNSTVFEFIDTTLNR